MESVTRGLSHHYDFYVNENADVRTVEWHLVYSPWIPTITVIFYAVFCIYSRKITQPLPSYDLKGVILAYNFLMTVLSMYMTKEFFYVAWKDNYGCLCQPVDYSTSKYALRMASVCWVYYVSKYAELLETFIFALRKKYNQISFLHCYHHITMLLLWWSVTKWAPGGQAYIFGGINSFVHFVMYTYYGLSAMGPTVRKYLWWKRHITKLQLSQFVILFAYCIQNLARNCNYPKILCVSMIGYAVSLLVLFLNFYFHAYVKKGEETKKVKST